MRAFSCAETERIVPGEHSSNFIGFLPVALSLLLHPAEVRGQSRAEYIGAMRMSAAEFQNDRVLASWADHIFVGQVLGEAATNAGQAEPVGHDGQPLVTGRFEVEVLLNIKGHLERQTIVRQLAGVRNGTFYYSDGSVTASAPLAQTWNLRIADPLQPGATYLFATRIETNTQWQRARPERTSIQLLSSEATLSREDLIGLAFKDSRVPTLLAIEKELEALFAEPGDDATAAVDKWLKAYGHGLNPSNLPQARRELDLLLEQVGERAALVVAGRLEKGDPRVLGIPGGTNGAVLILERLGSRAAPAVPILGRTLRAIRQGTAQDVQAYNYVIGLLLKIGAASPALEEIIASIPGTNTLHWFNYSVPSLIYLSSSGAPDALARLEPFLQREDYFVRLAAAVTIAEVFGISKETTPIIEAALVSNDQALSGLTTLRIGLLKGDRTAFLPAMVRISTNGNAIVSQSIGRLGAEALPTIMQMLMDERLPLRQQGAIALRSYFGSGKLDPNAWPIMTLGIASIADLSPSLAVDILTQYPEQAAFGYVNLLERLAQSTDPAARRSATALLNQIRSIPPAVP